MVEQREQSTERFTAFIGVDPGADGGLAIAMPGGTVEMLSLSNSTEQQAWEWLRDRQGAYSGGRLFACVELVGGYVKREGDNPGSAMFEFGRSYGALRMALVAAGIPFEAVRPQEWQRGLNLRTRGAGETRVAWKDYLKREAQRRFPQLKVTKSVADALLVADYARMKWGAK